MLKINYSKNSSEIDNIYINKICGAKSKADDLFLVNKILNKITFNSKKLTFEDLIVSPFEDLVRLKPILDKEIKKNQLKKILKKFNYTNNQEKIADFFMNSSQISLNTCFYCNVNFINPFVDQKGYKNSLDFLNNASKFELQNLKGVGPKIAESIISKRPLKNINVLLVFKLKGFKYLNSKYVLEIANSHNHFTLDHVIPKEKNGLLSLCFYNLIPSCYSCNSKFKKEKGFDKIEDWIKASPSSESFNLHEKISFEVLYDGELKDIKTTSDFNISLGKNENYIEEYLKIFKIEGVYSYHKKNIPILFQKSIKYPESKILEISKLTGYQKSYIRNSIFGEALFKEELTDEPLTKFRRDIAKNLNIKDVL